MTKGSIVVDELIVPIVDMYLDHGQIVLVAAITGPIRAVDTSDYVVLDRSGAAVYRSQGRNRVTWGRKEAGSGVTITASLAVEQLNGAPK